LQRFAAEQVATAELMSFVVAAEKPAIAARVGEIVAALAANRRRSTTIVDQIAACERAIADLWLLRFSTEAS
jgi:hypothetical protein